MSMVDSPLGELRPGRTALIVGAGRMGLAIAQIFASAGLPTVLVDPIHAALAAAPERLREICRIRGAAESVAQSIELSSNIESIGANVGFAIEAAPENVELKRAIFRDLEAACPADAILATNTSVIPVARIASDVIGRHRVVGAHFWNPPYAVRLVEVVQAEETSRATIEHTMALLRAVGQLPVHVKKDIPGFIGNRLQHALKREAIALVQAGVCDAETVDFVVRNSFGARLGTMGPLEQSDLVGLKLTLAIHEVLLPDLDTTPAPQQLLVDLVAAGQTGASAGQGFRTWSAEARAELQQRLDKQLMRG